MNWNETWAELEALFREGGWVLGALFVLAFGIAFALLSIWRSLPRHASDGFNELNAARAKRRIPFAFVMIGAAPLVGLLGTVSGMFTTFEGMAGSNTASPTSEVVSRGISEALITTQAGLIICVPGFIVATLLKARFEKLKTESF